MAGASGRFATTCWTDVSAAASAPTELRELAISALCRRYWYPLYLYVRGSGFNREDAEDVIQAFFAHVLSTDLFGKADAKLGRFRYFLLRSLQNFVRNWIEAAATLKRGGACERVALDVQDMEAWVTADIATTTSPSELFDLGWARATFSAAYDRLSEEMLAAGRGRLFEALKPGLLGMKDDVSYPEMAVHLGLSVSGIKVAMHRLRQRLRELVLHEIKSTVSDPSSWQDEYRYLIELLAR